MDTKQGVNMSENEQNLVKKHWWNELNQLQRSRLLMSVVDSEYDNGELTSLLKESHARLPPKMIAYYTSLIERAKNSIPQLLSVDELKAKRMPTFDKDTKQIIYDIKSIMTLLSHCYPAKRTKDEKRKRAMTVEI